MVIAEIVLNCLELVCVIEKHTYFLIFADLNTLHKIYHNSAAQFLNILVLSELCQESLLLSETGAYLIATAIQTCNRLFSIPDILVEFCLKDIVFLQADDLTFEVIVNL